MLIGLAQSAGPNDLPPPNRPKKTILGNSVLWGKNQKFSAEAPEGEKFTLLGEVPGHPSRATLQVGGGAPPWNGSPPSAVEGGSGSSTCLYILYPLHNHQMKPNISSQAKINTEHKMTPGNKVRNAVKAFGGYYQNLHLATHPNCNCVMCPILLLSKKIHSLVWPINAFTLPSFQDITICGIVVY